MSAVAALRDRIAAEGPPLADGLNEAGGEATEVFAALVGGGERTAASRHRYSLALESALEGYLVHFAGGRLLDPVDRDLRLLAGDYLYAVGFLELAHAGDSAAIEDLADLIAVCAALHSRETPPDGSQIAAVWALSALAICSGRWTDFAPAKQELLVVEQGEFSGGVERALGRARSVGLELELESALIAFRGAAAGRLRDT